MGYYIRSGNILGDGNLLSNKSAVYDLNGILLNPYVQGGQVAYTTPGTYSWTCPAGVTLVCVVCIGGGGGGMYYSSGTYSMAGGGGGGLGWKNNISVTPGQNYTVVVGDGGLAGYYSANSTAGGDSYFIDINTVLGGGGAPGRYNSVISGGNYTGCLLNTSPSPRDS